jgi:ferredoxin
MAGEQVRLGRQSLVFEAAAFVHYGADGKERGHHPLPEATMVLGRGGSLQEAGSVPVMGLDGTDKSLSRRHMSVSFKAGKCSIKDLQSANGTYLKVNHTRQIYPGEIICVGQQRFKLNLEEAAVETTLSISTKKHLPPAPSPSPTSIKEAASSIAPLSSRPTIAVSGAVSGTTSGAASAPRAGQGLVVTFKNRNKECPFTTGQTLCDIAEKNGIKITAECHAGICGSDPVRILSGGENCNPLGADEKGTLEDLCNLSTGEHRLACMVKPTGPIELEIL